MLNKELLLPCWISPLPHPLSSNACVLGYNQAEKSRSDGRARGAQELCQFSHLAFWVGMECRACTEVGWTALGLAKEEVAEAVEGSQSYRLRSWRPDCGSHRCHHAQQGRSLAHGLYFCSVLQMFTLASILLSRLCPRL